MDSDVLVIGAGIAGASAAAEIIARRKGKSGTVVLLEAEDAPGFHSTGRSAALYTETYGHRVVRALTKASRPFLERPPSGFTEHPILGQRGVLHIARADQRVYAERTYAECRDLAPGIRLIAEAEARALFPALRPGYVAIAVHEADAMDIDVNALHQGYLRRFRADGGTVVTGARVTRLERKDGRWRIGAGSDAHTARVVVNAAGAWGDVVAAAVGIAPLGLSPKRRTAITFDTPTGMDSRAWPMVIDAQEEFYVKPESGRLLASPADETPMDPCDVQPDELDIAITVDRVQQATTLEITTLRNRWAGLRSFFPDKVPVCGFDPRAEGFFWLAGQGGYGIMTSPALACLTAALITGEDVPADMQALGLSVADLSPARFLS
ncbi:MAG: FAD-binding oxidoreductase [Rhodospirillales bacterium]|nr:FAD-binding oxidoreductase [Rhodospirillales bacterium]